MKKTTQAEPELSPAVARRVKLSLELEEALAVHAPAIVAAHAELLAKVLAPGERPPDVAATLDGYRRAMVVARETVVAADLAYRAGLEKDAEICGDRDLMTATVSKKLARLRRRCSGLLGRDGLGPLGLAAPPAKTPSALSAQAGEAARRLRGYTPEEDREPSSDDGPDVKAWLTSLARDLEGDLDILDLTLDALEEERARTEPRLGHRKQAMADFDSRYLSIGALTEANLRLAGKTEEADRIHPSTRKLDRNVDDEGEGS